MTGRQFPNIRSHVDISKQLSQNQSPQGPTQLPTLCIQALKKPCYCTKSSHSFLHPQRHGISIGSSHQLETFTELPTSKHFYISLRSLVESIDKSQRTNLPLESEALYLKLILKVKTLFSHEPSCPHKSDNLDKSPGFREVWRTLCSPGPLNKLNYLTLQHLHRLTASKPGRKVGAQLADENVLGRGPELSHPCGGGS